MIKKEFSFLLLLYVYGLYGQVNTSELLANWAGSDALKQAHVGVAIHDVEEGYLIAGYNQDKMFVPASSLKLLTSLVTLHKLGQDFKYCTKLSYEGKIVDSVLQGNVYVIGAGDPSLGTKRFASKPNYQELTNLIVYKIQSLGIKKIEGDVIADASIFDSYPIAPSWQWNDLGSAYSAGSWGINVNENEYDLWFNASKPVGEIADIASIVPYIKDLELSNEVFISNQDTEDNSYIYGDPFSNQKRVVGSIPQTNYAYRIKGSIPDPPKALAQNIVYELRQKNIDVNNAVAHMYKRRVDSNLTAIDSFYSPPLLELVKQANYHSINMYCESFLKTLGYTKGNRGAGSEGISQIKNYLTDRAIDFSGLNMEDGSGLSARSQISPFMMSRFLSSYTKENGIPYTTSLIPEAGNEGTVRRLLKNSNAKGKVWMKSGTMSRIMSYTGIMQSNSGRWITFSIMVNGYTTKSYEMRKLMENIIDSIYNNI